MKSSVFWHALSGDWREKAVASRMLRGEYINAVLPVRGNTARQFIK